VCVCGISGGDGIHVLSAIAQQVQHGEVAKLLVELNRVGLHVGVQFPRCLASFRMNDGGTGRTNGRSSAQCGQRSTSPTGGIKSGKTPRRPQTSHVNGQQDHLIEAASRHSGGFARERRLPGVASSRHAAAHCTHQHQQQDPELSKPLDQ